MDVVTEKEYRIESFKKDLQAAMQRWGVAIEFKQDVRTFGTMTQVEIKTDFRCEPNWTPPQFEENTIGQPIHMRGLEVVGVTHRYANGQPVPEPTNNTEGTE